MKNQVKPKLTIVIATYNSEKLLEKCLNALEKQTLPKRQYILFVVDGGSTDRTKEIASNYGAIILHNPFKEPVHAKQLALQQTKTKYLMFLDSDEILLEKHALQNRLNVLKNKNIGCVISSGYIDPPRAPFAATYINEFGDPFSFFIYRLSKKHQYFLPRMKRKFTYDDHRFYTSFNFSEGKFMPIIELAAMGSVVDLEALLKYYPEVKTNLSLLPHHFYLLCKQGKKLGVINNDPIQHYSATSLLKYISKITWRIKNNIYHTDSLGLSGYTGRKKFGNQYRYLAWMFIPYNFLLFPVLLDAIWLAITRKNALFILHLPLSMFTILAILFHKLLFLAGYRPKLEKYG